MAENIEITQSSGKWKTILFMVSFIALAIISLVYYNKYQKQLLENQATFNQKIKENKQVIEKLEQITKNQSAILDSYKPYKAIMKSAALRDSIYALLPYKFGETVYIMPDSIKAIVNSISINGNATDYSIKYVLRTKKGEFQSVSITDIRK
jgi:hypothetical protein